MRYLKLYEQFLNLLKEDLNIYAISSLGFSKEEISELESISKIKPKWQVLGDGNSPDLYYQTNEFDQFFKKHQDKFKQFLTSKGISNQILDYWFRPDNVEHQEWIQIAPVFSEIVLSNKFEYKLTDFDPNLIMGDATRKMWLCDVGRRYKLYSFMIKGGYQWKIERTEEEEILGKDKVIKDAPDLVQADTTELKGGVENDLITCDKEKAGSYWNNGYWLGDTNDYSNLNSPKEREEKMIQTTKDFVTSGDQSKKPIVIYIASEGSMANKPQILDGAHRVFLCQWLNDVHGIKYNLKAIVLKSTK